MRWIAAAALLLVAGCRSSDPCFGHDGACIGLEVDGMGVSAVDQLRYRLASARGSQHAGVSPPTAGPLVSLPIVTAVYPPDALAGDDFVLTVTGLVGGRAVGEGSRPVQLSPGGHQRIAVTIAAARRDGGADGPPPDLASADMTGEIPPDLTMSIEDALPDVSLPPMPDVALPLVDGMLPACPPGSLLCDDFEAGDFNKWDNGAPVGGDEWDTLTIDGVRPWRGARSLHGFSPRLDGSANGGDRYLQTTIAPMISTGILAVRAYVYTVARLGDWTTLIHVTSTQGDMLNVAVANDPAFGDGYWNLWDGNNHMGNEVAQQLGVWQCVEVVIDFDRRTYQLFVTDAAKPDRSAAPVISVSGVLTQNPIHTIELGFFRTPGTTDENVFFDDAVIAPARIGCE